MDKAKLNRRGFLSFSGAAAATAFSGCASVPATKRSAIDRSKEYFVDWRKNRLVMPWSGLKESVKLRVIGDTHFNFYDERDAAYVGNYSRMAGRARGKASHLPGDGSFEKSWDIVTGVKKADCDAVLLVGDIVSFPTLANVDAVKRVIDAASVPCYYIAGNHDWHFEGLPGTSTPTYFDETCELYDEIAVSAGERGHQMLVPPMDLARFLGAKLVDITD